MMTSAKGTALVTGASSGIGAADVGKQELPMLDTLRHVIEAHGGLENWNKHKALSADLVVGGMLWGLKGQAGKLERTNVTVGLGEEWATHQPLGPDNRRTRFSPDRVAIEDAQGKVLEELAAPRASFARHALETPWTEPQLAYFAGYAMWTYLNLPFLALRGAAGLAREWGSMAPAPTDVLRQDRHPLEGPDHLCRR